MSCRGFIGFVLITESETEPTTCAAALIEKSICLLSIYAVMRRPISAPAARADRGLTGATIGRHTVVAPGRIEGDPQSNHIGGYPRYQFVRSDFALVELG
jgi:hypothetical protein